MTAPTSARRRPPGRYDERRPGHRVLSVLGAAVLAGLLVAGGTALYVKHNEGRVSYEVLGYAVSSDRAVKVEWEVVLSRGQKAECRVRARGRDGSIVGDEVVPVGPGTGGTLKTSYLLPTSARPYTGEVAACQEPVQP